MNSNNAMMNTPISEYSGWGDGAMTSLTPPPVKREHSEKFLKEKSQCLDLFHSWNEQDQIDFVEELLGGMCHYQHGSVNAYLKPMLQVRHSSTATGFGIECHSWSQIGISR